MRPMRYRPKTRNNYFALNALHNLTNKIKYNNGIVTTVLRFVQLIVVFECSVKKIKNMNSQQIIQLPYRLRAVFKLFTSRFNEIGNKIGSYEMPERIKGTFLERWGK